ncbi:MAG: hypothetical protein HYY40_05960 [Bacteroidetes bacterium]|nr:hypothetical protein [Bacteroidota bacterium]
MLIFPLQSIVILLISIVFLPSASYSQNDRVTVGLQYKPIFPSATFNTGQISRTRNGVDFLVDLVPFASFSAGMIIRSEITEKFSFESGINLTMREYQLSITERDFTLNDGFRLLGYEVPVLGLVYIKLGEKFYMNTSFGSSLDFFPSNVISEDNFFQHYTRKKNWIVLSLLANLGWEYRTELNGYYYLGASYHMPFTEIANTKIRYTRGMVSELVEEKLFGTYLTVDIRYFFEKKKKYNKYKSGAE